MNLPNTENAADFKLDKLPDYPTGEVTIYLTTADGNNTKIADENIISTLGFVTILPVGQRDPYPTSAKWDIHHMTGVNKLHAKGIRGKGIKIGIVIHISKSSVTSNSSFHRLTVESIIITLL